MIASTSILVDRNLVPQITSNGILLDGRTEYISLKLSYNENLTIANIYSARTYNERALMWKRLSEANFDTSHIIIGRYFNHLKETDQRGKAGERFMMKREATCWHHMTFQYGLTDAWKLDNFRKMSKKEYTFDNGRSRARLGVSCIDKFIVFEDLDTWGGDESR
jgi:hypothetical protein